MTNRTRHLFPMIAFLAATALFAPLGIQAQTKANQAGTSAQGDRWLHVRVISTDSRGETVKVNVPLELAEKVLPAIDHDRLHSFHLPEWYFAVLAAQKSNRPRASVLMQ